MRWRWSSRTESCAARSRSTVFCLQKADRLRTASGSTRERVQTLLVLLFVAGAYAIQAAGATAKGALPDIPASLLVLLASSNGVYLAGKITRKEIGKARSRDNSAPPPPAHRGWLVTRGDIMTTSVLALIGFAVILAIILAYALVVLWWIVDGKISLAGLIAEIDPTPPGGGGGSVGGSGGKASLSRFQFLLFTFVVAGLFLLLSIEAGTFVEIPANVLGLLGISGGSYLVSKVISK